MLGRSLAQQAKAWHQRASTNIPNSNMPDASIVRAVQMSEGRLALLANGTSSGTIPPATNRTNRVSTTGSAAPSASASKSTGSRLASSSKPRHFHSTAKATRQQVGTARVSPTLRVSRPATSARVRTKLDSANIAMATALWEFKPQGHGQLYMQQGEIVQVLSTDHEEWWMVQRGDGKESSCGWVPATYLQPHRSNESVGATAGQAAADRVTPAPKKRRVESVARMGGGTSKCTLSEPVRIPAPVPTTGERYSDVIDVMVPPGATPGVQLSITFPCGQRGLIVVPPGMFPGSYLKAQLKLPSASSQTPQNVTQQIQPRAHTAQIETKPQRTSGNSTTKNLGHVNRHSSGSVSSRSASAKHKPGHAMSRSSLQQPQEPEASMSSPPTNESEPDDGGPADPRLPT